MRNIQGSCLCGRTKLRVARLGNEVFACHCSMCRKMAGGPIFYTEEVPFSTIHFDNERELQLFESSEWGERGFCSHCGTYLFYRPKVGKQTYLNIELFDELTKEANFTFEIYHGDKPHYYSFNNLTKKKI